MQTHKTPSRMSAFAALMALFAHMFFSAPTMLLTAQAAADDYVVSGGDPGELPPAGAPSVPLNLVTLTDTDGDDFSEIDGFETIEVAINTADYPNVEFDTTVFGPLILIGGTCGHTETQNVNFTTSTTVEFELTGANGFADCGPGATITIEGLRIQTTAKTAAPGSPAALISVDNKTTSPGNPVLSETTFAYPILAPDAQATLTLENPVIGDVGDATLAMNLPTALDQDDAFVLTLPGHFMPMGVDMATTGTLGGASTFNCTSFGQDITCVADGPTNATGTVVMTGIVATAASTDDASIVVTNEGNLNDLIAEDSIVTTTDITAPSDNEITNIAVQDVNNNGKLDRLEVTVTNESGYSATSHSVDGWVVLNDGQYVSINSVTIDGQADANPLKIHVNLDETDFDNFTNFTTAEYLEVTYEPRLSVDEGFELDDFSDLQLAEIAAGDTDDTNTEKDGAAPFITNRETRDLDGDGKMDGVQLTFSEDVSAASLTSAGFVIATSTNAPLTETYTDTTDDKTLFLGVSDAPAMNTSDQFSVQVTGGVTDLFGNVMPAESAPIATQDGSSPVLKQWSYDLPTKKITLEWSESVDISHIDVNELTLQDAQTAVVAYDLTGGTVSQPTSSSVAIVLSSADQTAIDAMPGLLKAKANAYLTLDNDFIDDTAGRSNAIVNNGSAMQATNFITTAPTSSGGGGGGGGGGGWSPTTTTEAFGLPDVTISKPVPKVVQKVLPSDVKFSTNIAGSTGVAVTVKYKTRLVMIDNDRIVVNLPGFEAVNPTTTFNTPANIQNRTRFLNGKLIVILDASIPIGEYEFTTTGITLPKTAGKPKVSLEALSVAGDELQRLVELVADEIVAAPLPSNVQIATPLEKPITASGSVMITTTATPGNDGKETRPVTQSGAKMTVTSTHGSVVINGNTSITSNSNWNGQFFAPVALDPAPLQNTITNGNVKASLQGGTVNTLVEVGSPNSPLNLSTPAQLQLNLNTNNFLTHVQQEVASNSNVNATGPIGVVTPVYTLSVPNNGQLDILQQGVIYTKCAGSVTCGDLSATSSRLIMEVTNPQIPTCSQSFKPGSVQPVGINIVSGGADPIMARQNTRSFMFGNRMTAQNTTSNNTVTQPGFGITVNTCHFSQYAIVLGQPQIVPIEQVQAQMQPFTDVSETHPFLEAISVMKDAAIMRGYAMGDFRPDISVNRAEFLKTLIVAQFGEPGEQYAEACFSDVQADAWYAPYVCFAKEQGIISGYADGSFRPGDTINIAEAAKILVETAGIEKFASSDEEWFRPYLDTLSYQQAIPVSFITPAQSVSRGSLAEMVWRLGTETRDLPGANL